MAIENPVGPILRMSDEVDGVISAIIDDNPDQEVEIIDRGSYVRVQGEGRLVVTAASLQVHLGSGFAIRSLEGMLSSFEGRIHTHTDRIEWETGASRAATRATGAHA